MQSKYEVIGIVGEGAYGIVYKCRNKENGEYVAIKKFKETEDDIVKKTMSRELRALQSLKHDNIVEYKEAFKRKGNLYLVFEFVEKNLLEVLQENPKGLDPNLIKKLIFQLCFVVKYLHGLGIIHRDIKPENLLIDSKYRLKLCDFGFARSLKNNKDNTLTDYVATRWYRAPELLTGEGTYGPEIDYWAIGCIMGELVDGDPLFPGENELDQVKVIQKVVGKLTDEQNELIIKKNQKYKAMNFDVVKPETLERRYMGKLPKIAISFMKALLIPDPKLRLKGDDVLQHPYFEEFAGIYDLGEKKTGASKVASANIAKQAVSATAERENNFEREKDGGRNNTKEKSEGIAKKQSQPIISNTMNINIINYNNFNNEKDDNKKISEAPSTVNVAIGGGNTATATADKEKSNNQNTLVKSVNMDEKVLLQEKKLNKKEDLILTSTSFYKNKEVNNIAINGIQQQDEKFNTFYDKDVYNFPIDIPNKTGNSPENKKFGSNNVVNSQQSINNKKSSSNALQNDYHQDEKKASTKTNQTKKRIIENKFKSSNVIIEESYQSKVSPPKYEPYNSKAFNTNKTIYNVHLPTISTKTHFYKKK